MSDRGLASARAKMRDAGVADQAIEVFAHYYRQLENGATGVIREDSIEPVTAPELLDSIEIDDAAAAAGLATTAIIKLNGGLGTSMGMDRAKSLLPVRDGRSFLDITVEQVLSARRAYGVRLPLLFMNSFRTRDDTLAALERYPGLEVDGLGLDFLQNSEPKLRADDLTPVEWPADPALEWCPPGHGDLYPALMASGVLGRLLDAGYRQAFVSNADNLGAAPDARIAGWFAAGGAPYAAEICRRTAADRKGGHLAIRKADGRLILRDTAQTAADELHHFTDEFRHPYFHTNNLWFHLPTLARTLAERDGVLGLPLIRNEKTVDPADPSSTRVIQIESAMGAAIEVFAGATAIGVGRERFVPVKTTDDLLLLRSDVYELSAEFRLTRAADPAPLVDLDSRYYKTIAGFTERFPAGAPSLAGASGLRVRGDWTFEAGVVVRGAAALSDPGEPSIVPAGAMLEGSSS